MCLALSRWGLIGAVKGNIYVRWTRAHSLKSESCLCLVAPVRTWANYLTLEPRFPHMQKGDNNDFFMEM